MKILKVDEKVLRATTLLKNKYSIKIDSTLLLLEKFTNMLFRGSVIKEGSGKGIVVETR